MALASCAEICNNTAILHLQSVPIYGPGSYSLLDYTVQLWVRLISDPVPFMARGGASARVRVPTSTP